MAKLKHKKELEQRAKADRFLTQIFNKLSEDMSITMEALEQDSGLISKQVGGANNLSEFVKNGFGLAASNVGKLSVEQIQSNDSFKVYQKLLELRGLEIEVVSTKDSKDLFGSKAKTALSSPVTVACLASGFLPIQIAGGIYFGAQTFIGAVESNLDTAEFDLRIKKKQLPLLLTHMPEAPKEGAEIFSEIRNAENKAAAPEMIIK